jgi:hypothetical protein
MLFVTYWELNENTPSQTNLGAAQTIMNAGLFPAEGATIVRWDFTPDNWGILIVEAESVAAVETTLSVWRAAQPGFFKLTKTAPASPVQETIGRSAAILQKLGGAQGG